MHKDILALSLLILLGLLGFTYPFKADVEQLPASTDKDTEMTTEKLVLVELFTSQGCSSCPPADAVLQKLDEEAQAGDLAVVALSYHVDYWNRLGWKDPYSSAEFSQRQRTYAGRIADEGVYTPQIVIQGKTGHVGSREREVRSAIEAAIRGATAVAITAARQTTADGTYINYELVGQLENVVLNIAYAEKELGNEVPRGENRGRHLAHTNVVRQLTTLQEPSTSGSLEVNAGLFSEARNGKLVLFAQDKTTWDVLGVAVVELVW